MKRDSIIFYRSFYEAINELEPQMQATVYTALFEYALNQNEIVLNGLPKAIFTLIKPQLDANNKRFENGNKGGRPKPKDNQSITKQEPKRKQNVTKQEPNVNDNVNDNDNLNVNSNYNENNNLIVATPKTDLIFPFDSESFLKTWNILKSEPKWKKKTHSALQASLLQLSKNNEQDAIEMMNQSIAGGYQGLFELKNNTQNGKSNHNTEPERKIGRLTETQLRDFIAPRNAGQPKQS